MLHESVENLGTLKKKEQKVRDKFVPWLEFSSTSATLSKNVEEGTQKSINKDYLSGGRIVD